MTKESKVHVVLVTVGTMEEGSQLAEALVRQGLAACVNIIGPVRSLYVWEGKLQRDSEYLLIIKTTSENFPQLETAVRERHSYSVPEIIALPVVAGSAPYLEWVYKMCGVNVTPSS